MERKKVIRFELKQILEERKLTQEQFGKMCSPPLDRHQVSKLVRANTLTLDMLERIIDALELEAQEVGRLIAVYNKT